jgi:hypothetical protein
MTMMAKATTKRNDRAMKAPAVGQIRRIAIINGPSPYRGAEKPKKKTVHL